MPRLLLGRLSFVQAFGLGDVMNSEKLFGENQVARKLQFSLAKAGKHVEFERGADPPDFVFLVDNERWAVEVTELCQRDTGGMPRPATRPSGEELLVFVRGSLGSNMTQYYSFLNLGRHVKAIEMPGLAIKIAEAILNGPFLETIRIDESIDVYNQGGGPGIGLTSVDAIEDDVEETYRAPLLEMLEAKVSKLKNLWDPRFGYKKVCLLVDVKGFGDTCRKLDRLLAKLDFKIYGLEVIFSDHFGMSIDAPIHGRNSRLISLGKFQAKP